MPSFKELGISGPIRRRLGEMGIEQPSPIQEQVIPLLMEDGRDFIAQAQTGTGKTAAFGLPLLHKLDRRAEGIQGLIIAPTRELAKQIGKALFHFTKYNTDKVFVEVLAGGDSMDRQAKALKRPTQIVVATPGRLLDMIRRRALTLDEVRFLVLDEADEMLSMGFKKELGEILDLTAARKGTWLFSATFPEAIDELINHRMSPKAQRVTVDASQVVNPDISHFAVNVKRDDKVDFLTDYLEENPEQRGLIFARTRAGTIKLAEELNGLGHEVGVLHGDLTQLERDKVMRAFKKERVRALVATDVAARGLDVSNLAFVIHYQLPDQIEYYTHRAGRTARAGKSGRSIALVEGRDRIKLRKIEETLDIEFDTL